MAIHIIKTGLMLSIQDMGRMRYRRFGVPVGGCMDRFAARIANVLCGNNEEDAVLEIVLHGARLCTDATHFICFTGAGARVYINDDEVPLYRPILVSAGSVIDLRYASSGCRIYMAVAGGIDAERVMGSRSYASVLSMPALTKGSMLNIGQCSRLSEKLMSTVDGVATWGANPTLYRRTVRCLPGMEWDRLSKQSKSFFKDVTCMVSRQANRMGYILMGAVLELNEPVEMISTAVMPGTIQLTPNGSLIVLMADAQTTGGYPRIAQVIDADLPHLAQRRPEDRILFELVDIAEAKEAYQFKNRYIHDLQQTIALNFS